MFVLYGLVGSGANMNGQYQVASGIDQNVSFETDFIKRGFEYFDIYSQEIATHYGEVYWMDQSVQSLPSHIIKRFSDRTLIITGYEIDQVFAHPNKNTSIPITWVYNHHCGILINGEYNYQNIPEIQEFSEGNGGEYRKSYHGYPSNYGQLIFSPKTYIAMPMFIDTRNRDCGIDVQDIDKCVNENMFGSEPLQAGYGRLHKTNVSRLIHCPCTELYGGDPVIYGNQSKTKSSMNVDNTLHPYCDTHKSLTYNECVDAGTRLGIVNITKIDTDNMPPNCILVKDQMIFNIRDDSMILCDVDQYSRRTGSLVSEYANIKFSIMINATSVTITINGSQPGWLAIGIGAQKMSDMPWTIVVFPNASFQERRIGQCTIEGQHCQGIELEPVLHVVEQYHRSDIFSVTLNGNINDIPYKFNNNLIIPVILARGNNDVLEYHRMHQSAEILLISDDEESMCICKTGMRGLCNSNGYNCATFYKDCIDDLITTHNPTCTSDTYAGGLACCSHGTFLLDQSQIYDAPVLRYHLKWRFYFDDDNTTNKYNNLIRLYAQTEAYAGEYDVPPAYVDLNTPPIIGYYDWPLGIPTQGTKCNDNKCYHILTRRFVLNISEPIELIMISGHCHAPRCARMELWMDVENKTTLLCLQIPIVGKGVEKRFDEVGYIAIPPCLFGTDQHLKLPPRVFNHNTEFISIKHTENTHNGNYGEMASWQMRGAILHTIG